MTTRRPLTPQDLASLPAALPAWIVGSDRLRRELRFRDFSEAFGFMTRVALLAERLDHHPEWSNVWATVRIELTTHDTGGLTDLDVAMARGIDALVAAD